MRARTAGSSRGPGAPHSHPHPPHCPPSPKPQRTLNAGRGPTSRLKVSTISASPRSPSVRVGPSCSAAATGAKAAARKRLRACAAEESAGVADGGAGASDEGATFNCHHKTKKKLQKNKKGEEGPHMPPPNAPHPASQPTPPPAHPPGPLASSRCVAPVTQASRYENRLPKKVSCTRWRIPDLPPTRPAPPPSPSLQRGVGERGGLSTACAAVARGSRTACSAVATLALAPRLVHHPPLPPPLGCQRGLPFYCWQPSTYCNQAPPLCRPYYGNQAPPPAAAGAPAAAPPPPPPPAALGSLPLLFLLLLLFAALHPVRALILLLLAVASQQLLQLGRQLRPESRVLWSRGRRGCWD